MYKNSIYIDSEAYCYYVTVIQKAKKLTVWYSGVLDWTNTKYPYIEVGTFKDRWDYKSRFGSKFSSYSDIFVYEEL